MKTLGLATLATLAGVSVATVAGVAVAKPVVKTTDGTRGYISRTVTETWELSEAEKKNSAMTSTISTSHVMTSQLTASAIAPSGRIRRKEWTPVHSQHRVCFYNTYGATMAGKYSITLDVAGQQTNAFEVVPVGSGQGFCITRYLEMWVKAEAGKVQTRAMTHIEMDGQISDNEGNGVLDVR